MISDAELLTLAVLLALTAAIWSNSKTCHRPLRSLVAFDHG